MKFSSRMTIAMHILLYIVEYQNEEKITSEVLAETTGVNAVNIRKILAQLKEANLISIKKGIGGAYLEKKPKDINLKHIFDAVEDSKSLIFSKHEQPNINCPVGRTISGVLDSELDKVQKAMFLEMKQITLNDMYKKMKINIENIQW